MKTIKDENYSYNHVKERLAERHGLKIDRKFYDKMNERIKDSYPAALDNNGDQEIHTMAIQYKIVKVVYSKSKNRITTVLP